MWRANACKEEQEKRLDELRKRWGIVNDMFKTRKETVKHSEMLVKGMTTWVTG